MGAFRGYIVFTTFSSDHDCNDYDGCTLDFYNLTNRARQNRALGNESFSDYSRVTLEFIPDNHPHQARKRKNLFNDSCF